MSNTDILFADRKQRASQHLTIGTAALVDHIQTHSLIYPNAIYGDIDVNGLPHLQVWVTDTDHEAWLQSVHVDNFHDEHTNQPGVIRSAWLVRLPDTGTVVEIRSTRQAPALTSVGGVA